MTTTACDAAPRAQPIQRILAASGFGFEDRRLEITSALDISLERQLGESRGLRRLDRKEIARCSYFD